MMAQRVGWLGRGSLTGKLVLGLSLAVAVGLVALALIGRGKPGPGIEKPHLISMQASGQAMQRAGEVMQRHGQAMVDEGQQKGDPDLIAHGEHWLRDGRTLVQQGQWMTMNPLVPGSLAPDAQMDAYNRSAVERAVRAMSQDPRRARSIDVEALRWAGLSMRGEGQNMVEHARVMAEEVERMIQWHGLPPQAAAELRQAVETLLRTGNDLSQNAQAMLDYVDRLRRGMGYPVR